MGPPHRSTIVYRLHVIATWQRQRQVSNPGEPRERVTRLMLGVCIFPHVAIFRTSARIVRRRAPLQQEGEGGGEAENAGGAGSEVRQSRLVSSVIVIVYVVIIIDDAAVRCLLLLLLCRGIRFVDLTTRTLRGWAILGCFFSAALAVAALVIVLVIF